MRGTCRPGRRCCAAPLRISSGVLAAGIPALLPLGDGGCRTAAGSVRGSRPSLDSRRSQLVSRVMLDRHETVRRIEHFGVVAVIRLRDPGKLRAVVDAIAAGGVRALEITMTVPGAVDLIRGLAPTLPE